MSIGYEFNGKFFKTPKSSLQIFLVTSNLRPFSKLMGNPQNLQNRLGHCFYLELSVCNRILIQAGGCHPRVSDLACTRRDPRVHSSKKSLGVASTALWGPYFEDWLTVKLESDRTDSDERVGGTIGPLLCDVQVRILIHQIQPLLASTVLGTGVRWC